MKRAAQRRQEKSSLDLVEEGVHLVRAAPVSLLMSYYLGSVPFVLGLLFFWAEMSRSAYAYQTLAPGSLALAGLFAWMKFWQAIYARQLRTQISRISAPRLRAADCARIVATQTVLHATGLFLLPLAFVAALPFAWVYACYQNFTALGASEPGATRGLFKLAVRQAALWPAQNLYAQMILFGFGLLVFLNWASVAFLLPSLVKMLFGIESVFTRSGLAMLNTTFFTATLGLAYLSLDPLAKAVYALRCFYGEALNSGEDLKAELRALRPQPAILGLVCLLTVLPFAEAKAQPENPGLTGSAPPGESVSGAARVRRAEIQPEVLEGSIEKVLEERKYAWRMPRQQKPPTDAGKGPLTRFLENLAEMFRKTVVAVAEWLGRILERLFRPRFRINPGGAGYGWMVSLQLLLYALVLAAVAALIYLLYRFWRGRPSAAATITSQPIQPVLDLANEHVTADDLPEDGWTRLAGELLERGELRLALRAFYLAGLAYLAERNLITLARFKSDLEYERELRRRGHAFTQVLDLFSENLTLFERVWYGMHQVDADGVRHFAANLQRIKTESASPAGP